MALDFFLYLLIHPQLGIVVLPLVDSSFFLWVIFTDCILSTYWDSKSSSFICSILLAPFLINEIMSSQECQLLCISFLVDHILLESSTMAPSGSGMALHAEGHIWRWDYKYWLAAGAYSSFHNSQSVKQRVDCPRDRIEKMLCSYNILIIMEYYSVIKPGSIEACYKCGWTWRYCRRYKRTGVWFHLYKAQENKPTADRKNGGCWV